MSQKGLHTAQKAVRSAMESIEHSLRLKDGRLLAYHTFLPQDDAKEEDNPHPVLYFHGFPGCGLEGNLCALPVALEGGRLYAIDRPGMGRISSPYDGTKTDTDKNNNKNNNDKNNNNDDDSIASIANTNLDTFVGNVWELVEDHGWEEFSVIGVSGGGPYARAFLASYLERCQPAAPAAPAARLRNVCLVGAICASAGTGERNTDLAKIVSLAENAPNSGWDAFKLRAMLRTTASSTGAMFNYLIPAVPRSWIMYLNSFGLGSFPDSDKEWMSNEDNIGLFLSALEPMVAQGGYPGVYDDGMIVFSPKHSHEEVLREMYSRNDDDDDNDSKTDAFPSVGIFQGAMDVNVPPHHARYQHESIFQKRSRFFEYKDLGHVSTIAGKAEEYAAFATAIHEK